MVIVKLSVMVVVLVNIIVNYVLFFSKKSAWFYRLKRNEKVKRIIDKVYAASDYILVGGFTALVFMVHWLYVVLFILWLTTFIMCYFCFRKNKEIPRVYANGNGLMMGFLVGTIIENFIQTLGNF